MAGVMTTNVLPLQHSKELDKIFKNTLKESKSEYDKIFKVQQAPAGNRRSRADLTGLGLGSAISEGESVPFDQPTEGNFKQRGYREFGLGYIITKRKLDDERFGEMKKLPADLARSMKLLCDIEALRVFNEGMSSDTATGDHTLGKDGSKIWGAHTVLGARLNFADPGGSTGNGLGYLSNQPETGADLTETSFLQMLQYFDRMVDENGYPAIVNLQKLLISMEDKYVAHRLHTQMYGSSQELGGLSGQIAASGTPTDGLVTSVTNNIANPANGFTGSWSVVDSRFLDDDGRWFALGDQFDGGFFWKEQPKQTSDVEFDTDNIKYKSKMRFDVAIEEYAHTWGNGGTGNDWS